MKYDDLEYDKKYVVIHSCTPELEDGDIVKKLKEHNGEDSLCCFQAGGWLDSESLNAIHGQLNKCEFTIYKKNQNLITFAINSNGEYFIVKCNHYKINIYREIVLKDFDSQRDLGFDKSDNNEFNGANVTNFQGIWQATIRDIDEEQNVLYLRDYKLIILCGDNKEKAVVFGYDNHRGWIIDNHTEEEAHIISKTNLPGGLYHFTVDNGYLSSIDYYMDCEKG